MTISLELLLPVASSNLPGIHSAGRRRPERRIPAWSCTRWGLPCHSCHQERGELLPRHFTLTSLAEGGLFSVALSTSYLVWPLASILPYGARTFLCRSSGHPPRRYEHKIEKAKNPSDEC